MLVVRKPTDKPLLLMALGKVAKQYGITNLARKSGIAREHLYQMLSEEGNPTLESLLRIAEILEFEFIVGRT